MGKVIFKFLKKFAGIIFTGLNLLNSIDDLIAIGKRIACKYN